MTKFQRLLYRALECELHYRTLAQEYMSVADDCIDVANECLDRYRSLVHLREWCRWGTW